MIRNKSSRRLRTVGRLIMCLALISQGLVLSVVRPVVAQKRTVQFASRNTKSQDAKTTEQVQSERVTPDVVSVVNFKSLAAAEKRKAARARGVAPHTPQLMPEPQTIQEVDAPGDKNTPPAAAPPSKVDEGGPLVPSPNPSSQFQGEIDQAIGGGPAGAFTIPPDTMGAVGLDKVFVTVNNNYKVQDKPTGAQLSLVSIEAFWASTGATGTFDPRVQYDPYNDRWLLTAVSNAFAATSSVLVGVSQTSDPQGTYFLFRFIVGSGAGSGEWADFPMLGFNKNWVAIGWNPFTISPVGFIAGKVLVLDYPTLRTGAATATLFTGITVANGGFCVHPATTFSATENTLYAPAHQSSGGATYRLHRITGTPAAPVFTIGAAMVRPGGGWVQPAGNLLPQNCVSAPCPGTLRFIDSGDAFIRSNAVFRNGRIWYPQTIGIDLTPGPPVTINHTAAQWTALNTDGTFFDGGRVEDPTATSSNGGKWYAYSSISVNKNDDVLLGFSEFESDGFADAGYTFRLGTDAAGTMRDPLIFKAGEDYYEKTFSSQAMASNRWGDYSHTVVDPVNDRDLWTIQEYAALRNPPGCDPAVNPATNNCSRWSTWWAKVSAPAGAGDLIISEFRNRGPLPGGAEDEFVEVYNNNNSPLTVLTLDASGGYAVVAQDDAQVPRCVIPSGTVIPARGHYLCVNSDGYSLGNYPAGNGTTATGDATFTTDIPDNNGVAIFRSATTLAAENRLDSVGFTTTPAGLFKEGTGLPTLSPFNIDYSWVRDNCGKQGSIPTFGPCPSGGLPVDTGDNATDFYFVDTNGTSAGAGQRLGAPGPENLSSPVQRNSTTSVTLLDPGSSAQAGPNRVRDLTPDIPNNSMFGTLLFRRTVTNNTGTAVTRLRFRIMDFTTFLAPAAPPPPVADLRTRTSPGPVVVMIIGPNPACPGNSCTVQATTMETPPLQPNGGAFNSSLSAGTVTLATPIAPGGTVNVQFLLGVQQQGRFRFFFNVEALP